MSEAKIVYSIKVDTKEFAKTMRMFNLRLRVAIFIIRIAQMIGRTKLTINIEQEK